MGPDSAQPIVKCVYVCMCVWVRDQESISVIRVCNSITEWNGNNRETMVGIE